MLKSEVTRVSGPSSSSRRRSQSDSPEYENSSKRSRPTPSSSSRRRSQSDSPEYENSSKRSRPTPTSSSKSENDDDEHEEEGEVRSKTTSNPPPAKTTPAAPPRTGGLYMPPAKLRLLQVRLLKIIRTYFYHFFCFLGIINR
jgi:hypothetical protein